jgi:hypothetical protein
LPLPESVQLELLKVPAPLLVKLTVLVGVVGVTRSVSLTVAVQTVDSPGAITVGVQLTLVVVKCWTAAVAAAAATPGGPALADAGRKRKGCKPDA